jgi:hypothetical protein
MALQQKRESRRDLTVAFKRKDAVAAAAVYASRFIFPLSDALRSVVIRLFDLST